MTLTPDAFFTIGKTHTVCQDYAHAGFIPGTDQAYAIVSDGCSGSPDTDFGSRFMVTAAIQVLAKYGDGFDLSAIAWKAKEPTAG